MFSPKDVWFAFDYALDISFAPIPYVVCVCEILGNIKFDD
jgi:hypothetical protein